LQESPRRRNKGAARPSEIGEGKPKMTKTKKMKINRRSYSVVYDEQGVIRVWYENSVMGQQPIHVGTRVHKKVMVEFEKFQAECEAAAARFVNAVKGEPK